jgi:invasion protein IalB
LNNLEICGVGPQLALRLSIAAGALIAASIGPCAWSQSGPAAWRVECVGDGKVLACKAIQQTLNQEKKLLAQAVVLLSPDKVPVLSLQLPLGLNVSEPVLVKVDMGKEEKLPMQTCTNAGCFLAIPLKDPLLTSLRTGQELKLAVKDTGNRTIDIDLSLLGFGLAFDKATK